MYRATYYANELLSMIYERNAWWKMKQQTGEECHANDNGEDDEAVPAAVDLVTLIPNREDGGILVSCIDNDSNVPPPIDVSNITCSHSPFFLF